jgi:acyl carrier protein phosphodiesterase
LNFLAHLYLSGTNPKVKLGNFIGDFVKGSGFNEKYERDVALGIELHREIDLFTDSHEIVRQSKLRLRPTYRHYSAVIVDVYYDHFLAAQWNRFSKIPLREFADDAYQLIHENVSIAPEQVQHMLPYMINGNWLVNYGHLNGIQKALSGMASRTPYASKMEHAVNDLREHYGDFSAEFNLFFPQAIQFSRTWLAARIA